MKKILLIISIVVLLVSCSNPLPPEIKSLKGKYFSGQQYQEIIDKYGLPDTLKGTGVKIYVGYFPKGNFTVIMNKSTRKALNILYGKQPQNPVDMINKYERY